MTVLLCQRDSDKERRSMKLLAKLRKMTRAKNNLGDEVSLIPFFLIFGAVVLFIAWQIVGWFVDLFRRFMAGDPDVDATTFLLITGGVTACIVWYSVHLYRVAKGRVRP